MHEKKNIIIVDDDDNILGLISEAFKERGFRVQSAKDGVEALRLLDLSAGAVDVLLTDVVMPRLNGRDLARVIQSHHPAIKIIFMSGYPDDVLTRYGIPSSNILTIRKPFTPANLVSKVCEVLNC